MTNNSLHDDIESIVRTTAKVLEKSGEDFYAELLMNATVVPQEQEVEEWNRETFYYFVLNLKVPIDLFIKLRDIQEQVEKDIQEILKNATRTYRNQNIPTVIIDPVEVKHSGADSGEIIYTEKKNFWTPGYFKLFISHESQHKDVAIEIQEKLKKYAISAFVAHKDIEPTKEWQVEIELALDTMDALVALLTEGFRESEWCDQEVGAAIGKKTPIVPIQYDLAPYGFIGKFQAIATEPRNTTKICNEIFNVLLYKPETGVRITGAIVNKLCYSREWKESIETLKLLERAKDKLTSKMKEDLAAANQGNRQVYEAFGVKEKLNHILQTE